MKILLDECVPWPLYQLLPAHECQSPARRGWAGIKNGELLAKAEPEFDLFITADQSIRYQQNLLGRKIAIIELSTNKWRSIRSSIDSIRSAIASIRPGEYVRLNIPL